MPTDGAHLGVDVDAHKGVAALVDDGAVGTGLKILELVGVHIDVVVGDGHVPVVDVVDRGGAVAVVGDQLHRALPGPAHQNHRGNSHNGHHQYHRDGQEQVALSCQIHRCIQLLFQKKIYKTAQAWGIFQKTESFFATLYTKSVEKATGNRCFLAFPSLRKPWPSATMKGTRQTSAGPIPLRKKGRRP